MHSKMMPVTGLMTQQMRTHPKTGLLMPSLPKSMIRMTKNQHPDIQITTVTIPSVYSNTGRVVLV
jgi:hypothetical protein